MWITEYVDMYMYENTHLPGCNWSSEKTHATEWCVNMHIYVSLFVWILEYLTVQVNGVHICIHKHVNRRVKMTHIKIMLYESSYVSEWICSMFVCETVECVSTLISSTLVCVSKCVNVCYYVKVCMWECEHLNVWENVWITLYIWSYFADEWVITAIYVNMKVWVSVFMCVHEFLNVWKYMSMNVSMLVWDRECLSISWLWINMYANSYVILLIWVHGVAKSQTQQSDKYFSSAVNLDGKTLTQSG